MLCIYLVNTWSWPNKLTLLYSEGAQYLYVAYGQFVLGFLTTLLLCVLCILWNKETNILRNVYLQKNKSSLGINNGFFDYKIRIIPNQYEFGLQWGKKTETKTFAPFICSFFFTESSFECVSCRNIMSAFLLPHQVNTVLLWWKLLMLLTFKQSNLNKSTIKVVF